MIVHSEFNPRKRTSRFPPSSRPRRRARRDLRADQPLNDPEADVRQCGETTMRTDCSLHLML